MKIYDYELLMTMDYKTWHIWSGDTRVGGKQENYMRCSKILKGRPTTSCSKYYKNLDLSKYVDAKVCKECLEISNYSNQGSIK